jgi:ADP-ribosylglycohydrolase
MTHPKTADMLMGALIADAASLGTHWIYDPDRIAEIAARQNGDIAFTPVDATNFEDVPAYFAHGARENGMLTQYGEVLLLAINSMNATGGAFDVAAYQSAFVAHFGPGGTYQGYIDRPTRGALDNIFAEQSPSGIDDDQNPAIARLPAIMARYHRDPALAQQITDAMQVTNINDVAAGYNTVFADVLARVLNGDALNDALTAAAHSAPEPIKSDLSAALTSDAHTTDFAGEVGRACHLPTAGPVAFHVLKHATSYADAVNRNIFAGGDTSGRAIIIGAIAATVHGIATPTGVPLAWVLSLTDGAQIWANCEQLAGQ